MRFVFLAAAVVAVFATSACGDGNEPVGPSARSAVYDRVFECSGGISSVKNASLNARIASDLMSGNVSAGVTDEIRGLINNDTGVPAADKARVYETYVTCLRDIRTGS